MIKRKKIFLIAFSFLLIFWFFSKTLVFSQTATPTETPTPTQADNSEQAQQLENRIKDLQNKISELQGQEKTLSSQISVMDNQIKLTQLRIDSTKAEIKNLEEDIDTANKKISGLEKSLQNITKALLNRIVATYRVGSVKPIEVLLTSNSISNFFTRASYLRVVQAHDKKLVYETQQAKNDYSNQKDIFEDKKKKIESLKKQLEGYTAEINQEKKSKQTLLAATQNDEQMYQKLLREAQAQIQAFKSYSLSKTGGAVSILPPQPSPDGWFYNQRDERWGRNAMGSSNEQVWDVGCLVTSVAMVLKKHGSSVTPSDIAANNSYFFSNTAYLLLPWAGGKFSSTWGFDQGSIDGKLSSGEVVIVGLRAGVYGQHFVVLKSGSNGDYVMNDPWNGPDLKFSDFYSTSQIFQYGFYNG